MTSRKKLYDFRFGSEKTLNSNIFPISKKTILDEIKSYGWIKNYDQIFDRDRQEPSPELRHFALGLEPATFRLRIQPGLYKIIATIGDNLYADHITIIEVTGLNSSIPPIKTRLDVYNTISFCVQSTENHIDFKFSSPCNNWIINRIEIEQTDELEPIKMNKDCYFKDKWKILPESENGPHSLLSNFISNPTPKPYISPTNIGCTDYLQAIEEGIRFFINYQNEYGAIIDPYLKKEFQYATPCFAFAAGLIASKRNDSKLLNAAIQAFEWASQSLAKREAATAHEDFYPSPLAHAYAILKDKVDQETQKRWQSRLLAMDPFDIYRHVVGGSAGPGSNWNCKALAGEYLFVRQGLRDSSEFIWSSLLAQGRLFDNEFGLYSEGPFVYDIFPRAWLYDMLQAGFSGPNQLAIEESLDRGAITSLFMQGPTGALPIGGRSGLHLWGDALQILIFEIAAIRWSRRGLPLIAGVFKRAARRTFSSLKEWKRPTGEYWIVKNKVDPLLRHGYEAYSSHSQYNLLLLTIIGYAYEHGLETESIEERITPTEYGGYYLNLPKPFNSIIANSSGTSIQITKEGYPHQTPRGLVRIQFLGLHPSLPISEGSVQSRHYHLDNTDSSSLAFGLVWKRLKQEESFFNPDSSQIETKAYSSVVDSKITRLHVEYQSKEENSISITEDYELSNRQVHIQYEINGPIENTELRWPIFQGDGQDESKLSLSKNALELTFKGHQIRYSCSGVSEIIISSERYAHRGGYIYVASAKLLKNRSCCLTITHL